MKISVEVKRKYLFFGKHTVEVHADCSTASEANSIELSVLQLLGQIRAFDWEQAELEGEGVESEEGEEEVPAFGFSGLVENKTETKEELCDGPDLEGGDDGYDPEDEMYEDEDEDDE